MLWSPYRQFLLTSDPAPRNQALRMLLGHLPFMGAEGRQDFVATAEESMLQLFDSQGDFLMDECAKALGIGASVGCCGTTWAPDFFFLKLPE